MLRRLWLFQQRCGCKFGLTHLSKRAFSEEQKFLNVAVIGAPNAGKSTWVNHIVGLRVSAVTHVAHTTRSQANGILNIDNTQLVFTDTPGTVVLEEARRLKMHRNHIRLPKMIAAGSDVIAVVTDAINPKTKHSIDQTTLAILQEYKHIPAILIINKVDRVLHKGQLLSLAAELLEDREKDQWGYKDYGGYSKFKEVFYTSALLGEGFEPLIEYFLSQAKPGKWVYSPDIYSDTSVEKAIAEVFRENLFTMFGQEIPWHVRQETLSIKGDEASQVAHIHQMLWWPRQSQKRYVLSKENELKEACRVQLSEMFSCVVELTFDVHVNPTLSKDDVYM